MQTTTFIIQSHRKPTPYAWLQRCIDSVNTWAELPGIEYSFKDDEMFKLVPAALLKKTASQKVIATDLDGLYAIRNGLSEGYQTVVWLDTGFYHW